MTPVLIDPNATTTLKGSALPYRGDCDLCADPNSVHLWKVLDKATGEIVECDRW